MDIALSEKEQKRKRGMRLLSWAILPLTLVGAVWLTRLFIQPSADYGKLRTSVVQESAITASITASGTVVPEFEQIISSPIQARIDSVFFVPGSLVKSGSPILKLDLSSAHVELDKLEELIQIKRNEVEILRLRLAKNLAELQAATDIKELSIRSLETALEGEKQLAAAGGGTQQDVAQAALQLQIARRELQQLQEQITNQQQTNRADLTSLQYEIRIEEKNRNELQARMQRAQIEAPRDAVLIFVKDNKGAMVQPGEEVVRLADLSRFKVEARISDAYAGLLSLGGAAKVRLNKQNLTGIISAIQPEVKNGQVAFMIRLDDSDAQGLRPNLQVEVQVVTAAKADALLVKNGAFFKGKQDQKVFVVQGEEAVARTIDIGLTNLDSVEVIGLEKGDRLIISDMSEYSEADVVALENVPGHE